jgi:hypothetical protein
VLAGAEVAGRDPGLDAAGNLGRTAALDVFVRNCHQFVV